MFKLDHLHKAPPGLGLMKLQFNWGFLREEKLNYYILAASKTRMFFPHQLNYILFSQIVNFQIYLNLDRFMNY